MLLELQDLLGADAVFSDETTREAFAGDQWQRGPLPDAVVRPRVVSEVSRLLKWANERKTPVTTRGGGWGYVGGAVTNCGGVLLSLDRMNAIREISNSDFVAEVEAGVITADLHDAARENGLFYPPDPASAAHSTLGGNIAANAAGPRCLKYGVTRNYVLGLEVVLADGTILKLGGRTHKNVTGFDLVGLFVGSEGMLGVVTSATLRLLPLPPSRMALAATFSSSEGAAHGVGAIFEAGILPSALEFADENTLHHFWRMQGLPFDENAGAHLLVECDGQPESVRHEIERVGEVLRAVGASNIEFARDEIGVEALWATRRAFSQSLSATGLAKWNEDIVVPRGKLVELVEFGQKLGYKHSIEVACFGHAGDGNIHVNLLAVPDAPQIEAALDELFAQVLAWGGAITGEHGIGLAKKKWWPQAVSSQVCAVHESLKKQFDPHGILNPGKWLSN